MSLLSYELGVFQSSSSTKEPPTQQQTTTAISLQEAHVTWSWRIAMGLCCCSKRLHSIFVLRLFNEGPTMVLLYLSIWFFINNHWKVQHRAFRAGPDRRTDNHHGWLQWHPRRNASRHFSQRSARPKVTRQVPLIFSSSVSRINLLIKH